MPDDIFWEIHSGLPQEAPGSDNSTFRALSMIPDLPDRPDILDVGCGPGRQTLLLANNTGGHITAVDNHQPFLDEVRKRAQKAGLAARIKTVNCSMSDMNFNDNSYDLIWSEGAVYIMGFRKGLSEWRTFLKPGGYIAITELSWLKDKPPQEAMEFWKAAYPAMKNIDENVIIIENAGYKLAEYFTLPDSDWTEGYFGPLRNRIIELRTKYSGNNKKLAALDEEEAEIEIFKNYSSFYGYVFYVMSCPKS
jgi:SAM-dependent methyltransferase